MICKFYISALLKRELFVSRDRRDDSLLFKIVSKRGVLQFYCRTSNLGIFPRDFASLLGSKIREFNLSSRKRNRCKRVFFFFFIIYVSILTAEIFRGGIFMRGVKTYRGFVKRYIEGGKSACSSRCIFVLCMKASATASDDTSFALKAVDDSKRIEKFSRIFHILSINNFLFLNSFSF